MLNLLGAIFSRKRRRPPIKTHEIQADFSLFLPSPPRFRNTEIVGVKCGVEVGHGIKISDTVYRVLHVRDIEDTNLFVAVVEKEPCDTPNSGGTNT